MTLPPAPDYKIMRSSSWKTLINLTIIKPCLRLVAVQALHSLSSCWNEAAPNLNQSPLSMITQPKKRKERKNTALPTLSISLTMIIKVIIIKNVHTCAWAFKSAHFKTNQKRHSPNYSAGNLNVIQIKRHLQHFNIVLINSPPSMSHA